MIKETIKTRMKKLFKLTPLLSTVLFACTSNEPLETEIIEEGSVTSGFLTLKITETGNLTTRGAFDELEEGLASENIVKNARFYFFDESGNLVKVKNSNGSIANYIDWEFSEENDSESKDNLSSVIIEGDYIRDKNLTAHLTVSPVSGEKAPESVVAILNYTANTSGFTNLSSMRSVTGNFDITETQSLFVMSNSVYADEENKKLYDSVKIEIFKSQEEADDHPFTVYVERVNAKVRLKIGQELINKPGNITLSDGTILYNTDVDNTIIQSEEEGGNKVFVKFLGWNVTCEPTSSFLLKNIDPEWNSTKIFGSDEYSWTSMTNKRCYWAINPTLLYDTSDSKDYRFGDFNFSQKIKGFGNDKQINYAYLHENGAETKDKGTSHPTQVIVAAQLVNSKGDPLEMAQWGGTYFLKEDILRNLANIADIYEVSTEKTLEEGSDGKMEEVISIHYSKLDEKYYKFVSATEAGIENNEPGRYYAYLQLDKTAIKDKKLSLTIGGEEIEADEINGRLAQEIPPAKIWTEGYTYYYFDIEHLSVNDNGTTVTTLGVVRNHLYEATIMSLTRLGTPVFDKKDVIIPEIPDDDESFIYAQINIINWRLTSKLIQLEW